MSSFLDTPLRCDLRVSRSESDGVEAVAFKIVVQEDAALIAIEQAAQAELVVLCALVDGGDGGEGLDVIGEQFLGLAGLLDVLLDATDEAVEEAERLQQP